MARVPALGALSVISRLGLTSSWPARQFSTCRISNFVGVPTWLMSGEVAGNVVNEEDGSIQGAHGSR
jgi:hypothetical protein